ncbi:DUF488 family protein, N3 subclade [Pseudidiomarina piscicola]|uniref:Uncharacterized protein n=1 Tax=Pseudidiomarina piscicola TaxID=2614830 RepID=A0A6S6WP21_9GAMM|nr:hypothetical protein [Pseudidiomarina piscicola]CAB0151731.1 hypothetical protein PSI9734_02099 [Pseudidiomarina piscicola]VZT41188.1 hypothetical protein PSI9734_02099 [Pseudomonas aeruginosa]
MNHGYIIDIKSFFDVQSDTDRCRAQIDLRIGPPHVVPLLRYARESKLTLLSATKATTEVHLEDLRERIIEALQLEDAQACDGELQSPVCFATEPTVPTTSDEDN